ncbi:MAG: hypothetical protein JW833_07645, partial [Prolixibacteraceae bacterium]|nr:hypothetical protein [Prolixibacteraceae bacterium]
MKLRKTFFLYINLFLLFHSFNSQAQTARTEETDNIREKIEIIKKYLFENNSWYISNSRFKRDVEDLIYFVEKQNLDSVITKVGDFNYNEAEIISRPPSFFADTLNIKGFIPSDVVRKKVLELRNSVTKEFLKNDLQVPAELLTGMDMKAGIIPQEEGMRLFTDSIYHLPDSLLF